MLNYRSPKDTVRCVHALLKQTIANQIEILVVDNHSEDDSIGTIRNRLGQFPNVRIIETPANLGYGQGNGFGIQYAAGTYIFVTNPDNELEASGLERMVRLMESDSTIGIVAPRLVHEDGSVRPSARAFPSLLDVIAKRTRLSAMLTKRMDRYLRRDADMQHPTETDWTVGACLLMRRATFEKLGGFDKRFFLFFEDTDLCRRMWEMGLRVLYDPTVTARDRKRRLSEGNTISLFLRKTGRIHISSAIKYFWKWRGKSTPRGQLASVASS